VLVVGILTSNGCKCCSSWRRWEGEGASYVCFMGGECWRRVDMEKLHMRVGREMYGGEGKNGGGGTDENGEGYDRN